MCENYLKKELFFSLFTVVDESIQINYLWLVWEVGTNLAEIENDFWFLGELGCSFFGYIPDAFSNNLPLLPSESSQSPRSGNSSVRIIASEDSSRSASPRGGDE